MDLGLSGARAIVTGGTRGIGRAIAEHLAEERCDVAICGREAESLEAVLESLRARGVRAIGRALNVRDQEAYRRWLISTCETFGGLDIFVANVSGSGGMDGKDAERDWYRNFEVDLMALVSGCDAVGPALKKSPHGAVVIVGDVLLAECFSPPSAYNAIKTAFATYTKQLSQALFSENVRVNLVSPGPTKHAGSKWEMLEYADPGLQQTALRRQPQRRFGAPAEVARCAVFLASPAASWVTGVHLSVDGGFSQRVLF